MQRHIRAVSAAILMLSVALAGCGQVKDVVNPEARQSDVRPDDSRDIFDNFVNDGLIDADRCDPPSEDDFTPSRKDDYEQYLGDGDDPWPAGLSDFNEYSFACNISDPDERELANGSVVVPESGTAHELYDFSKEESGKDTSGEYVLEGYVVTTEDWLVSFDTTSDEAEKLSHRFAEEYDGEFSESWGYQELGG